MPNPVRVIVLFTESEVALLDRAVAALNRRPGDRTTRSDLVRQGALSRAASVLAEAKTEKEAEGKR